MKPVSILYVEDNDDLRDTIGMLMEGDDRQIVTCANGEEALAAYAEHPYEVLVTDVSLPGISGMDLARHVLAAAPAQWVVLCSGYEFRGGLGQLGPNVRSLAKPFELEDLESLLGEIVAAVRTARAA